MPQISVIIPVYNTEKYVARCLRSILQSTYQDFEIICVDDGSTDKSLQIMREIMAEDPRVRIIEQKNAGVSAARNRGLDAASGKWIAFVDSDDWIHPQYFEVLMDGQEKLGADVVMCGNRIVSHVSEFPKTDVENLKWKVLDRKDALSGSIVKRYVWGKLYRKSNISDIRFSEELTWREDTTFNVAVFCSNPRICVGTVEEPLYYYYRREESVSHQLQPEEIKKMAKWYLSYGENFKEPFTQSTIFMEGLKTALAYRYLSMFSEKKKEIYADSRELMKRGIWGLKKAGETPFTIMLLYMIFVRIPLAYRIFRIINDPTMLTWEKIQKTKQKSTKIS